MVPLGYRTARSIAQATDPNQASNQASPLIPVALDKDSITMTVQPT